MLKPGWFPEFLPKEQAIFDKLIEIIESTYKSFWYHHIQTPAVERNDVLLAKSWEEVSKQIFWLYWLAQWCEKDKKDYSLHFDLTVPFARYVIDHENELWFPFKRYQIQSVWRWERQQKWRYREFFQCDIDVIWKKTGELSKKSELKKEEIVQKDYIWYDIEIIWVLMLTLSKIFKSLNLDTKITLRLNNRKIIDWILEYFSKIWFSENFKKSFINLLDKFWKIWEDKFYQELKKLVLNDGKSENVYEKLKEILNDENKLKQELQFAKVDIFFEGESELDVVYSWVSQFLEIFWERDRFFIVKDLTIVRGLDYYSWTVFETFIKGGESIWSICSWWRYDNLTGYIDPKKDYFSWVWGSIWINRLFDFILEKLSIQREEKYLIVNFGFWDIFVKNFRLMRKLIEEGKIVEIYPYPEKLKKQFRYADKMGYKYVITMGEDEVKKWIYKIKNLETGEEEEIILDL